MIDFFFRKNSKDGQQFDGSIFHKVNGDLSAGVQLAWTSGSNATKFGIGAQYALDKNSTVRAKISNDSLIGKFSIQYNCFNSRIYFQFFISFSQDLVSKQN